MTFVYEYSYLAQARGNVVVNPKIHARPAQIDGPRDHFAKIKVVTVSNSSAMGNTIK